MWGVICNSERMWYQTARCLSFAAIISPPRRGNTLSAGSGAQDEGEREGRMDGWKEERAGVREERRKD